MQRPHGPVVESLCAADPQVQVAAGFDILGSSDRDFPVFSSPAQFSGEADAVIDFSSPAALEGLLDFARATGTPLVLATTGYTPEQVAQIGAAALEVPIFRSANMSLGINVLLELVKKAASVLGDSYDIEIVERHHRRKVDAPSGTALMIADAAAGACGTRRSTSSSATASAIPVTRRRSASPRSGAAPSWGARDHLWPGHDEVMEIRHTALSREIFAQGAVEAAKFMAGVKAPGLYDMSSLIR